jgi:DNA modification methylase
MQETKIDYIYNDDALSALKTMADASVDCIITSPPYYGLRDYGTGKWIGGDANCPHYRVSKRSDATSTGHKAMVDSGHPVGDAIYKTVCPLCGAVREDKQIGLEETPEQYVQRLVEVFREAKRVLKDDGTFWLNIGDTYNTSSYHKTVESNGYGKQGTNKGSYENVVDRPFVDNCKEKDLIGIPWMLAFALRADGWYLRQDIIWSKPNPMPEPIKDRCTKSHEYIFLFSKKRNYFFDYQAIQEDCVSDVKEDSNIKFGGSKYGDNDDKHYQTYSGNVYKPTSKRNKRDVWSISVQPTKEAHFATFPEELVENCIKAGCPKNGIVLDTFFGSGTTGLVAHNMGRHFVGIELNPEYIEIAKRRVSKGAYQMDLIADYLNEGA